jgi:adenylate cyclase
LRYAINLYNRHRANSNYPPINIGIVIHFGPVIISIVGSNVRMDTTFLGDIVISAQTLHQARAKGVFEYRLLDWVS